MRFDTSQQMKLGQQMKLAPKMIQSMEILQLPMLALQERIDQELESNIALEQVESGPEDADASEADAADRDADTAAATAEDAVDRRELVVGEDDASGSDDFERLSSMEADYGEAFDNEYSSQQYSPSRHAGERDRKIDAMANIAARRESLTDQLMHQWTFADVDPATLEIGKRIIAYIGSDGLLTADLDTILEQNREVPGIPDGPLTLERLDDALNVLQRTLDPPGVAARSVRECLLLQIDARESDTERDEDWSDARMLIEHHFDDLLQNRLPRIAQKSGIPIERIQHAVGTMKKLTLSPARDLVDDDVPPVIPDVIVDYDEQNDQYIAALADGILPTLRVSKQYATMSRDRELDKNTREFVTRNVQNAAWLIESLNQRKNTLLRVVNVVLSRQRDFFDHGPQHLKSLPMIEVADQLGIHVATVSRAVSDKWMQTPRGMFPLRRFFSGGTETASGQDMSWEAVKATLKDVIEGEDKSKPLSDEALASELKKRGIDIARRTVVKYRSQLGIPSARQRKQY